MKTYSMLSYVDMLNEAGLLVSANIIDDTLAIEHITYDSKKAKEFTLFACKGVAFKEKYLIDSVKMGIACYVSQVKYDVLVSSIIVSDVRKAMALIADMFYDKAYEKLNLVGITGTKGKSTTAYYLKYIFDELCQENGKKPSGIISSIDTFDGVTKKESVLTTPEAFELHEHFDNAVKSGLNFMEMEVSSQALKYDRVLGVKFDIAVFLNISSDHISPLEHSDFDDYLNSKLKIFEQADTCVVNLNADYSEKIMTAAKRCKKIITFGTTPKADIYCYSVKKVVDETHFCVAAQDFDEKFILTMPGLFNVENALAAIAVARYYGISVEIIKKALFKARSSGRMELFSNEDNTKIAIVDYAHNKLSFEKLYESVLEEYKGRKIITVFGCPGGKALNRRKELGELAGKFSDKVYLTAEDPGYEEVEEINKQIEVFVQSQHCECHKINDRGQAIIKAISDASENSIILITGKGNETRQKIGKEYVKCLTDSDYAKQALLGEAMQVK